MASSTSTMVHHSTIDPAVKGLNPAVTPHQEKMGEKKFQLGWPIMVEGHCFGATALSITALSIMTFSIIVDKT